MSDRAATPTRNGTPRITTPGDAPNVLLVSGDPHWMAAVGDAVTAEGGRLERLPVEDAIGRLAGSGPALSHVLVDPVAARDLTSALIDLASDGDGPRPRLLLLGPDGQKGTPAIPAPDPAIVAASLAVPRDQIEQNEPGLEAADLQAAIDGDMIQTWYQPIVSTRDRRVVAVEVLARLRHPIHGAVGPDWFVARFEDAGLSSPMTDVVSAQALTALTGPRFAGLNVAMALNYPLRVLTHPDAARILDDRRAALGLTPDQVQIELTESRPVDNFAVLGRAVERLRTFGYQVLIDDVGPAVPNLQMLLALPFSGLKLDKGIVRMIGSRDAGGTYAPTVIDQALARGMTIVAEGVETQKHWDQVRALGVHEAQGYFIARPLPAAAVRVWMENWAAKAP